MLKEVLVLCGLMTLALVHSTKGQEESANSVTENSTSPTIDSLLVEASPEPTQELCNESSCMTEAKDSEEPTEGPSSSEEPLLQTSPEPSQEPSSEFLTVTDEILTAQPTGSEEATDKMPTAEPTGSYETPTAETTENYEVTDETPTAETTKSSTTA